MTQMNKVTDEQLEELVSLMRSLATRGVAPTSVNTAYCWWALEELVARRKKDARLKKKTRKESKS
jgi:hypothetical protein